MKKLPVILLLAASLLLTACNSEFEPADDEDDTKVASTAPEGDATTTPESDTTTAPEGDTTTAPESDTTTAPEGDTTTAPEQPDDPDVPVVDEVFADLMEKYPIVSEPTGSFASGTAAEVVGNALKDAELLEDFVVQLKASIAMNMGALGSQDEQVVSTITKFGDAYKSVTETTSMADGVSSTTTETNTFVDGYYYYFSQFDGDDEFTEKIKIKLTRDLFDQYVLGETDGEVEGIDDVELSQFADMLENAIDFAAGMTAEGGCRYFAGGLKAENLEALGLMESFEDEFGGMIAEDSLSKIAIAISLDKDGNLEHIYIDLPLEFSISEGDFSMTFGISIEMEISVRAVTADDKIEAPADADSYQEMTVDEYFEPENWFDEDWFTDDEDADL